MKKDIKATNIEMTEAIRNYVNERIDYLDKLIRNDDESVYAQVEIEKTTSGQSKGDVFRAEINLHLAGKNLRAEKTSADLYASIDAIKDEMTRELTSHKDKQETMFRRGARKLKNMLKFGRK